MRPSAGKLLAGLVLGPGLCAPKEKCQAAAAAVLHGTQAPGRWRRGAIHAPLKASVLHPWGIDHWSVLLHY
uniref:Secreted protein n=1 Tax=Leersia perrieri TaxID=77586 RepID=A0A0D9VZI7_9ORYZ